ncbi:heavy metal translocating P-type ATPase [Lachnoanaerobaculum saburreum]|uniref:Cd(2+)-exporting ATPase n=1 Tax=Lachnoanaerobaculum saburreum DSM 3986 TaxID=887325 RepID=E6LMX4_9FIRM|nr:heavy metal translocating P-type ATPase [Lachnoanaerobaculum saburreum DSM 3986]
MAQKRMTIKEADMLQYYLEGFDFVRKVIVYERTCDVAIYYKDNKRESVIKRLKKFNYNDIALLENMPNTSGRQITREFQEKMVGMLLSFGVRKMFFPNILNSIYTVIKAAPLVWKGIKCLVKMRLEVDLLDALSVAISIVQGNYSTAGSLMLLLDIGNELEDWTHKKSVDDLARSMSLNVDKVWLVTDNEEVSVPISHVKTGDLIRVHTGNVVPLDGDMVSGEAMLNQASLTGESVPVEKRAGSRVYAGTVVEEGECLLRATVTNGQSRYDKIVSMIEDSEKLKSNTENMANRLADRLVPYSLLTTGLTYLFTRNITRALSVLMVDFSCALKLSMPLAVLSAMREAGNDRITVKGGKFMEAIAKADTVVFDKTGTLTYACPKVQKIIAIDGDDENQLLKIAACLEEHYPHSIANAVVKEAKERKIRHKEMHSEIQYVVAHGIASTIEGDKVVIGSYHFVIEDEKAQLSKDAKRKLENLDHRYSHLFMAIAGRLAAIIEIADPLRKEAKDVLKKLKALGIKKTVMMTGDNQYTAEAIAKEVGVDKYYAEVLPEDKASYVEKEKAKGRTVIMIGDGINDSPALSAADCGIAISEGAAIAREIADVCISADDLNELVKLKELSNKLTKRVESNFRFIMGFNGSLIGLGILGILAPGTSSLLHNASTVGIALSSMTNLLPEN